MHRYIVYGLLPVLILALTTLPGTTVLAVSFADFSSITSSSFSKNPWYAANFIALAALIFFLALTYAGYKYSQNRETKNIDRHYEIVKHRQEKYAEVNPSAEGQKRQWFRLNTRAEFEWLPPHRPAQNKRPRYKRDQLIDISAGGVGFLTSETVECGNEIKLILHPGEGSPMYLNGTVVRVTPEEKGDDMIFSVGVCFDNIRTADQDRLLSWIIKRQRSAIKEEKTLSNMQFDDNDR